ncbi:adenosylcobinamide-GDP ribazoletransferase [Tepidibacter hydrothermalis]|uniref:Adenosylcobinamide-GDP ribazoletransferase n=1 Tax=Tepidibacter hydrothermalis TaxID=3036126 RepID=A0ABY8EFP2_9FIRM|nr:adenosylcobinamide-GDP ribazoletransferase [Tepidibacter hydrothermalis]WFD09553.1 adenosylcobinamide-GDP ribazoletransferase [Tepidibacter hydrothermalis]
MNRFLAILTFLTRIPVKVNIEFDENFNKGMIYFPTVGLILGILYCLVTYITTNLFGVYIGSVIFVLCGVVLTGGLHLDGVGDTFDGIYSYRDKERMLEIMKDSRLGTNALLAVLFVILLKIGFVYKSLNANIYYTTILMPVYGRIAIAFASYNNKSPRKKGMGNVFIGQINEKQIFICCIFTILYIALLNIFFDFGLKLMVYNIIFMGILWILIRFYTKYITNIIGGITGDILGCICELTELIYLLFICLGVYI